MKYAAKIDKADVLFFRDLLSDLPISRLQNVQLVAMTVRYCDVWA
jgi:hypothetical protein